MRSVVLVKQVPDVRAGAVAIRPDGTIDRASAPAITNPADLHALEAGLRIADEVWAVSMGPARAETTLREALALGADEAVLVSDRAFAGSDTWATANALAAVVRRIGGVDLVLCGVSALDGETGQVGPQVAQRLGMPHVTSCEDLRVESGRLVARRIIEGGYEQVSVPLPALATITETGFRPRYPALPGRTHAAQARVATYSASDLALDASQVGLRASPTKVAHMEAVPLRATACRFVGDDFGYDELVAELRDRGAFVSAERLPEDEPAGRATSRPAHGGSPAVWVVCEIDRGRLARVSAELLSKSGEIAPQIGGGVAAVCIGKDLGPIVEDASRYAADVVLVADDPRLDPYRNLTHSRVIVDAVRDHGPQVVLFGATTTGRDLAPRVAATLDTGLAADCTDLFVADWERRREHFASLLHQVRPALAGGVLATCVCPQARPQMATVRPGVFAPEPHPVDARVQELPVRLDESDLVVEVLDRRVETSEVSLAEADVLVAGGAGCKRENWELISRLSEALGGRVAASRGAVEAGLAPRSLQVGQTGATVRPKLYIACGISGALQHVVGMAAADTIVAINRDPEAPIFHFAHYGIVGDVTDEIPRLTEALTHRAGA